MKDVQDYLDRLREMRSRLVGQLDREIEEVRDSIHKPGEQVNLHTHNADMDVEGLDEAVGVSHALEGRLKSVEGAIGRLTRDGEATLKNTRERERLDALLDLDDFTNGNHEEE